MKPDGFTMATTEPIEAVLAEPPAQGMEEAETLPEQPTLQPEDSVHAEHPIKPTAPPASQEDNDKAAAAAADTNAKAKGAVTKARPGTAGPSKTSGPAGPGSRPGTTQSHMVNGVKPSTKDPVKKSLVKKTTTTTSGASAPGVGAKKPPSAAASSSVRTQPKVTDKKPVGPARATSAPVNTQGTKTHAGVGLTNKRPTAGPVNGTKPKTTAPASRPTASVALKPSASTAAKGDRATAPRTARPATAPTTSRPAFSSSTVIPVSKPPSTLRSSRPAAPRAGPTAPSTGRTAVAPPTKTTGPAKKDVGRPASTVTAAKKTATSSAALKTTKPDPTKPAPSTRPDPALKRPLPTKAAEPKAARSKPLDSPKPAPIRKPPATRQPLGTTPPASPANRPAMGSTQKSTKRPFKPTQSVQPFTAITKKKPAATEAPTAAGAATVVVAAAAAAAAAASSASVPEPEASVASPENVVLEISPAPAPESPTEVSRPQAPLEKAVPSPPRSSVGSAEISSVPTVVASPDPAPPEGAEKLLPELATSLAVPFPAATIAHQEVSASNLNEEEEDDEEDEEREGSQQVSVSEMSGTQPTEEESRPGSASQAGGSAWRAGGGALLSELDSEEVSCSQQGASELSAPGVLEGTESTDDLGDGSLKEAIDMEGASAGTPDFEKVHDIGANDFDEDEEDEDRVCDMDVGSERAEDPRRARPGEEEEEDEDVEMASEGITESGLESYGNADEDDFAEDERLDNLNRGQMLPGPVPVLPSSPAAQWNQPNNPLADPWAQSFLPPQAAAAAAPASPSVDPWQADSETPIQSLAQPWLELGSATYVPQIQEPEPLDQEAQSDHVAQSSSAPPMQFLAPAPPCGLGMSQSSSETSTPEELRDYNTKGKLHTPATQAPVLSLQPDPEDLDLGIHLEKGDGEEEEAEAETLPADEVLGGPATAPTSDPSSSSTTEDEASDMEGEAQLEEPPTRRGIDNGAFDRKPADHHCMAALEEGEEAVPENGAGGDSTPPSANSATSYGFFDATASNSNAHSAGESCTRSPGIFSLEELPEEAAKGPGPQEQHYMLCAKMGAEGAEMGVEVGSEPSSLSLASPRCHEEESDAQPPYYSTICDKTENSLAGLSVLTHPHRRDHSAPRPHCDILTPPRLTCADLPPRSPCLQVSPQLRRLEQHHKQLLELQQRQDLQGQPEDEEGERRKKDEEERRKEEQRRKEEETEEVERKRREVLELQLQQQQEELKQRQQIRQWQQELEQQQPQKGQSTALLSPSSGLCTIYEALENSDSEEEAQEEGIQKLEVDEQEADHAQTGVGGPSVRVMSSEVREDQSSNLTNHTPSLESTPPPSPHRADINDTPQGGDSLSPPESPARPSPLDLDWGKKVDIVQQLINQTLMLTGDGCSSLLLLPGGGGGTLSPLESSLWPNLLAPLTPPSATVTSVSSFSPEAPGSSPQGEWTVVELETHH